MDIKFSLYTKNWQHDSIPELASRVSTLGFNGIELPLREGYQVNPKEANRDLSRMNRYFAEQGLQIFSIAPATDALLDEALFEACAEAEVPLIRVMVRIGEDGYQASEGRARRNLEQWAKWSGEYGVKIGVQQHCGDFVSSSAGLMRLLQGVPSDRIGAVWDVAHSALQGELPEHGLELVWPHLYMVNFKNAYYRKIEDIEAAVEAQWQVYYTTSRQGLASWSRTARYLKKMAYSGVICLTAEYSEHEHMDRFIAEDIAYAKTLFAVEGEGIQLE